MSVFFSAVLLFWVGEANADPVVKAGADFKSFGTAVFPLGHAWLPADPQGAGMMDFRLKADVDTGDLFRFQAHHAVTASTGALGSSYGLGSGIGGGREGAVDDAWSVADADSLTLGGRMDRLLIRSTLGPVEAHLGRQAISVGNGRFFTPMDLVNPFTPTTIDTDYKPGIDAAKLDLNPSASSQVSAVAAYGEGWESDDLYFLGTGQFTVGVTDLGGMVGSVLGDLVGGVSVASSIGPVGVYGDVTLTDPAEAEDDRFVRAVVGLSHQSDETTNLGIEVYHQSVGATDVADYLVTASNPRFARGELWLMGRTYVGASASKELTPLVHTSTAFVANIKDGSVLMMPGMNISVAESAELVAGAMIGVGQAPFQPSPEAILAGETGVKSEFGLYPLTVYIQTKTFF